MFTPLANATSRPAPAGAPSHAAAAGEYLHGGATTTSHGQLGGGEAAQRGGLRPLLLTGLGQVESGRPVGVCLQLYPKRPGRSRELPGFVTPVAGVNVCNLAPSNEARRWGGGGNSTSKMWVSPCPLKALSPREAKDWGCKQAT